MAEQKGPADDASQPSTLAITPYQYILLAGEKLKLPQPTVATAVVLFYRVQTSQERLLLQQKERQEKGEESSHELEDYLLLTSCINLACKTTEVSRKVRDIINVGYRILHPTEPPLRINEEYWQMKDSLSSSELIVLRILRFEMDVELPYPWINKILKGMCYWKDVEIENDVDRLLHNDSHPTIQAIFQLAWAFAHDCLRSRSIMLSSPPIHIALACVHLAIRSLNATNPQPFHEWCKMWGVANSETIKSLVIQIMSL
ncbi:hypothetical protein K493DRAFT_313839 [Basidiobolus meristosporus CBS 931.73]|uniref:Uncharacterized protein n=1 Tax=Basidiobolus meristosporus CBS 931.73 TaxID=1314790 RepID=A0A1Y1YJ25_9FUNG|nr:hypothetical protein K493DRAFT_313839 [Basidiobolus meristosporus CBS 931.73]|eukprot:ORX97985.1 hypothetical protein K493DRAFT_313839 [Basidiobolus meristosporus CBS 931.73]